jgi:hypothetical protein
MIFTSFYVNPVGAATPLVLGADTIRFNWGMFTPQKSETEDNAGVVTVQTVATNDAGGVHLSPGQTPHQVFAPNNSTFNASQFWIDAAQAGDGVLFTYSLTSWKTWHAIESKLEEALVNLIETISATLDDCTVTAGLSDMARDGDSIHAEVTKAVEEVKDTGLWTCSVELWVQTPADGTDRLERHRLRTAYVRDLFMDGDNTTQLLSVLCESGDLAVQQNSIKNRQLESTVHERKYVSKFSFEISCCGTDAH